MRLAGAAWPEALRTHKASNREGAVLEEGAKFDREMTPLRYVIAVAQVRLAGDATKQLPGVGEPGEALLYFEVLADRRERRHLEKPRGSF